ncbi:MAG: DUF4139 domain-containing protein [Zoogloeaceae bacterium]|nr:DUF4139 domain-containing protein [Zoogloeaceae bacterium]
MNAFRLASLTLFSLVFLPAAQVAGQPVSPVPAVSVAPVSQVVLYPGSALIERAASVRAGANALEISGLPANFNTDSVQVEADSGIEIGEIVWRDSDRTAPLNAEEARLEAEVRKLADRIDALNLERQAAERELKYLDALVMPGEGFQGANPAKTLEIIRQGSLQAQRRILGVDAQKRDIERDLKAKSNDLERIRPNVNQVRVLSLRLSARNDGQVRIRYLFQDAGWRPAYRAALDSETGQVTLERIAQIAQRSGEDWGRVNLRLSTGLPRHSASGPQPTTWDVALRSEQALHRADTSQMERGYSEMQSQAAGLNSAGDAREYRQVAAEPLFAVDVTQGEYATEYQIPGAVTLPADGRKVAVSLGRLQIPVRLEAQVSPRQEKSAYLVAHGELPEGVWPSGEMQLYRNGAYVGVTHWNANASVGLELPFGRDALIKVSGKSTAAISGSSGFAGQKSERHIADTFTITNLHKRPVDILLLEATPVARNEAIEVTQRFTPEASEKDWNNHPGILAWKARLEAGSSQEISVDYRIRWPKDRRIIGLP